MSLNEFVCGCLHVPFGLSKPDGLPLAVQNFRQKNAVLGGKTRFKNTTVGEKNIIFCGYKSSKWKTTKICVKIC